MLVLAWTGAQARGPRAQVLNPGESRVVRVAVSAPLAPTRLSLANGHGVRARLLGRRAHGLKILLSAAPSAPPGPRTLRVDVGGRGLRIPLRVAYRVSTGTVLPELIAGRPARVALDAPATVGDLIVTTAAPCVVANAVGMPDFGSSARLPGGATQRAFRIASLDNHRGECRPRVRERLRGRHQGRAAESMLSLSVRPDAGVPEHLSVPRLRSVAAARAPRLRWWGDARANAWEVSIRPRGKHGEAAWRTVRVGNGQRVEGLKAGEYEWKVRARYRQPGGLLERRSNFSEIGRFRVLGRAGSG